MNQSSQVLVRGSENTRIKTDRILRRGLTIKNRKAYYRKAEIQLTNYQLIVYNEVAGGVWMSLKIISTESDVIRFLTDLKEVLIDSKFDVSRDLDILPKKKTESPADPYTTFNTMLVLEFDRYDIKNQLLALDTSEYLETFIDDKDNNLPQFFAFGKTLKNREVYIKVKIRDRKNCKVFCVSFHFARFPLPTQKPFT